MRRVANELGLDIARLDRSESSGFTDVFYRFVRQILCVFQDMLDARELLGFGRRLHQGLVFAELAGRGLCFSVVLSVFSLVAFLRLHNQYVKLFLAFL